MISRFADLKPQALALRTAGNSIRDIELKLGIPRSTLSGWFKSVALTPDQQAVMDSRHVEALAKARLKASESHRSAKQERIRSIGEQIDSEYSHMLPLQNQMLEMALAMLYLGEGTKGEGGLGLGNSDSKVICFYIESLKCLYEVSFEKLNVQLHLRADQDEEELKNYWSQATGIPLNRITSVTKDQRTAGRPTYPDYKGVCYVAGGGVEIQRRLLYLAEVLVNMRAISSAG